MSVLPAGVSLDTVLATQELYRRPTRIPDYQAESIALHQLVHHLASSPATILDQLATMALTSFRAGSAGVSLISGETGDFYWPAIAGAWQPHIGGGTPRHFGPCAVVLERQAVQLFASPEKYHPYLEPAFPSITEVLLSPFYADGKAVGTVWVVSHEESRRFDAEDARFLTSLCTFASAAYQNLQLLEKLDQEKQRLAYSEERFRTMANAAPAILWLSDASANCLFLSQGWHDYSGQKEEDALLRGCIEGLHSEDRDRAKTVFMDSHVKQESFRLNCRVLRKDGGYRRCLNEGRPIRDDQGCYQGHVGSIVDVHDVELSDRRLHLLSQTLGNLLRVRDPDLILRELFAAVADDLGADVYFNFMVNEKRDGLMLHFCAGIPDDIARTITCLGFGEAICGTVAQTRRSIHATDIQSSNDEKAALARSFGIQAYACSPLLAGDTLLGTLSFASRTKPAFDVDSLRFIEIVAQYTAVALDRAGAEKSVEAARHQAVHANTEKDRFLAVLSHELRTPLTPILMTLAEMQDSCPPSLQDDVQMVRRNVELQAGLIDDLLDLSLVSTGKLRLNTEQLDVIAGIRHAIQTCRPMFQQKSIEFLHTLPEEPIFMNGDPGRIQQIFLNVLRNASKFTPSGRQVKLSVRRPLSNRLEIDITDTGPGIEPTALDRIFEPFEQSGPEVTRRFGGMGLGLTITKALVEMHRGSIKAASLGLGDGATFTIELPLTDSASSLVIESEKLGSPLALRILLVEDHEDTSSVLSRLLRKRGYYVKNAATAAAAFQRAEEEPFDVLLCDIGLPDATGYDLMREFKRRYAIKGIAMTGYGSDEDVKQSREAEFEAHILKPVDMSRLEDVIRRLVREVDTTAAD